MNLIETLLFTADVHNDEEDGEEGASISLLCIRAVGELRRLQAELANLRAEKAELTDPAKIHAMMLRGVIPCLTWRQHVHLSGPPVPNTEDERLAEIVRLNEEKAEREQQKPIKYLYRVIDCFGHDVLRDDPKDATILETIPLYAAPVPTPTTVPDEWRNRILSEFPLLDDAGLCEEKHHCEWAIQQDRKRLHTLLQSAQEPKS